eukprot:NODE_1573_length_823_cov_284.775194_g1312_i0.p1 GENE.NODE_1573_length_823_cov_284.775194_g1312_i0~~NODE_1573_length_823_cov_284.775194_g1312_i0.p1  ORF type:complete len:247 (+),score=79.66 NODE_1573_length_823_cov_284.775194_g1312_i0:32-742(+)
MGPQRYKSLCKPTMAALFAEIQQKGDNITTGLKHVTKDMKSKGSTATVPGSVGDTAAKKVGINYEGTPKFALEDNKWTLEFTHGDVAKRESKDIELDASEMSQSHSLYIYRCRFLFVKVPIKVNSVTLVECKKVCVQFQSLISTCEVTNCDGCEVQVLGSAPSVQIDKSDNIFVHLSKDSLSCELITSSSRGINVTVPNPEFPDETVDLPVPEQFVSTVEVKGQSAKLVTKPTAHI